MWIEINTSIINLDNVTTIATDFEEAHLHRYKIYFIYLDGSSTVLKFNSDEELWEALELIKTKLNVTLELEGVK